MQLLWYYKSAAPYDLASPIEAGGTVYASDVEGNLAALNANTGAVIWNRSMGAEVKETPSVYDGHLFIGTFVNAASKRSVMYALNPATGTTDWQASVPGGIHGPAVALNGELYVPVSLGDPGFCNPGGVYEFDESAGTLQAQWLVGGTLVANGGAVWSPLTYDGTRILFGTGNTCLTSPMTANAVVALSPAAKMLWADQTANPRSDDDVGGGVVESGGNAYVTGKNGKIYAINPATGSIVWQENLGVADFLGSYSTPAIVANTLITSVGFRFNPNVTLPTGTQYGGLEGLDPSNGAVRWQITATAPFFNPPAIVAGMAITTVDASVAAIDSSTGATLWSSPLEAESRSGVAAANGLIYVGDSDGMLYAYGVPTTANEAIRRRTAASLRLVPGIPRFINRVPAFCVLGAK